MATSSSYWDAAVSRIAALLRSGSRSDAEQVAQNYQRNLAFNPAKLIADAEALNASAAQKALPL